MHSTFIGLRATLNLIKATIVTPLQRARGAPPAAGGRAARLARARRCRYAGGSPFRSPHRPRAPMTAFDRSRSARAPHPTQADAAALLPAAAVAGRLAGLVAAFSTALPRLPDPELAARLRELVQARWAPARAPLELPLPLLLRQTHSARVLELDGAHASAGHATAGHATAAPPAADGAEAGAGPPRLLAVKSADCVPLLAVDAHLQRYAALHAGWRGTAQGILPALLERWRAAGSSLHAVHLELGPHIRDCCYEVRADCLAHFDPAALRGAVREQGGRSWLSLAALLRGQALRAGVPAAQVTVSAHCTYCEAGPDGAAPYASYRRDSHRGEAFSATNVGLIGRLAAS
jgi:purine-nucleoside/S-methyl-5'-thioadenosine phosphorylase / adenosine deaminase